MNKPFRYTFRFCCDMEFNGKQETEALMQYVQQAQIDDVAVFVNVQEMNTGHLTFSEQEPYLAFLQDLQMRLCEAGVSLSINNWHSIMHADLGKKLSNTQTFNRMVDINGKKSDLCVCPLCEEWQTYFCELYARYAKLNPAVLWVEDDFRFHNHEPLAWGGCFCDAHMRLYSQLAGKQLTREEFIAGVLQPGTPHAYRQIWLDVCRRTLVQVAKRVGDAVRAASHTTQVGLMSSAPHIHAAEGRDWHGILEGFAAAQTPVNRVHLPGYIEPTSQEYIQNFNMVSMLTRHFLPLQTQVYPELENYPYSLFTKSRRFTRYQLLSSLALNEQGMTIDLYDLNGNGIVWEENFQQMLREVKPFLETANATGVFQQPRLGVQVMCSELSAYTLHTQQGQCMEELYPQEVFFAGLLPIYGIPFSYCSDPDIKGEVVAVSGQYFRNLTSAEIKHLFAHNAVIVNGDALHTLCSMGLGDLAGVTAAEWKAQNSGAYTFEQVTNGHQYVARENARASAVISCADALYVEYGAPIQEYTAFYNAYRARTGIGQVVVNDTLWVFPFGRFSGALDIPPMLRNTARQEIAQDIIQSICKSRDWPMVQGAPYLVPYCWRTNKGIAVYLVNAATDPVSEIVLQMPQPFVGTSVRVLGSNGESGIVPVQTISNTLRLPFTLDSLETVLIFIE